MRGCRGSGRRAACASCDGPGDGQIPATVLGLDIGGSSSRARVSVDGRVVHDIEGPGANVATIPLAVVTRRLDSLLEQLGPINPTGCCAGAAGAEVPARRARLESLLRRRFPGCRVEVVHDARLVLAAAGLDEGIAVIAGTGSVAYGRTAAGREARFGGWGWMLGDGGSGVWIAREGAREVMRRADAGDAAGPLGDALFAATRTRDSRAFTARLHAMREPMRWAALAAAVFDAAANDEGARLVIEHAAEELAALAASVRQAIQLEGPVVMAGGVLLKQPTLEAAFRAIVSMRCVRLDEPPVEGAVRLAERLTIA